MHPPAINFGVRGSELQTDTKELPSFTDRKAAYQAFLLTPFWRDIAQRCIARDLHRCTLCRRNNHLHAHHVFYRPNWFDTQIEDLKTLCEACHAAVHGHTPRVTNPPKQRAKKNRSWKPKKSKKRFGKMSMAERRERHFKIFGGWGKKKNKRNRNKSSRPKPMAIRPGVFRGSSLHNGGHYKSPFDVPR